MGGKSGGFSFRRRRLEARLKAVSDLEAATGATGRIAAEPVAPVFPPGSLEARLLSGPAARGLTANPSIPPGELLAPWE